MVVLVVGAVRRTVVVVAGVRTVGVTAPHAADVGHRSQGLRLDHGRLRLRRGDRLRFRRGLRLGLHRRRWLDCRRVVRLLVVVLVVVAGVRAVQRAVVVVLIVRAVRRTVVVVVRVRAVGVLAPHPGDEAHRNRGRGLRMTGLVVVSGVVVTGLGAVEGAIMVVLIIRAVHGAVVVVAGVRAVGIGAPHPGHKGHGTRLRRGLLWSAARRLAAASGQQEYQRQQADPNLIVPHNRNSLLLWFLSHSSAFNTTTVVQRCQEGPAHSFLSGGESRGRCYKRFLKKDKCFI